MNMENVLKTRKNAQEECHVLSKYTNQYVDKYNNIGESNDGIAFSKVFDEKEQKIKQNERDYLLRV